MSRVTEINKGVFIQQDTQSPAQVLPSKSVNYTHLETNVQTDIATGVSGAATATAAQTAVNKLARFSAYVVGQAADVTSGVANYSGLQAAVTAAPNGSTIYVLPGTYTLSGLNFASKKLTIQGSGFDSILNGTITLSDMSYCILKGLQFNSATGLTIDNTTVSCFITEC